MKPEAIRRWRPTRAREFVGAENRRLLYRLGCGVLNGTFPSPILLLSPFGYGKTSSGRWCLRAFDCEAPDPVTGDPCLTCGQCRCFGTAYEGTGFPYRRFEIDCTQVGRPDIIALCREHRCDTDVTLFFDEIHHLHERNSQEALLKFVEDFRGLIIAAVMEDRYLDLIPPLRERFETVRLVPPTEDEMVAFFQFKCLEWRILATEAAIRAMVRESGLSFRFCLRRLAEAASRDPRRLDPPPIEGDSTPGDGPAGESPRPGPGSATDSIDGSGDDGLFSG